MNVARGHRRYIRNVTTLISIAVLALLASGPAVANVSPSAVQASTPGTIERTAPVIVGSLVPGATLSVDVGEFSPSDAHVSIRWAVGSSYVGSYSPTLTIKEEYNGKQVSARVVLSREGYTTSVKWVTAPGVVKSGFERKAPTIGGALVTGGQLKAYVGNFTPSDATVAYQWYVDGVPLADGKGKYYVLKPGEATKRVSVRVWLRYPGLPDSVATATRKPEYLTLPKMTVSGTWGPEATLTASLNPAPPPGAIVTYRWLANGATVPGETGSTFVLRPGDASHEVQAHATIVLDGYYPASVNKKRYPPAFTQSTPRVTGTFAVGSTLVASPGVFTPSDADVAYQWYVNGVRQTGETEASYTLQPGDTVHRVMVRVTLTRDGYRASGATKTIYPKQIIRSAPKIVGSLTAGTTLVASPGPTFPSDVQASYQWYVGGVRQTGETGATFTLTAEDTSKRVMVQVTLSKDGYFESTATKTLYPKKIERPNPSIGGQLTVGSRLIAYVGSTTPADVKVSYQWYVNGVTVDGGTSKYFTVREGDAGKRVSVHVTVAKEGYLTSKLVATRYP